MSLAGAATLRFLGGAGTVTGSKYLIRAARCQVLLDCGLFQGLKELRLRNWSAPAFDPGKIDAVILSHAHLDHSGYLPRLVRGGFRGKVYCTSGTADLVRVLLMDSARLQEEEAENANRKGYSKHKPALALYTQQDAQAAFKLLRPCRYGEPMVVADGVRLLLRRAGHILGSSTIELMLGDADNPFRLVFSGDLGRWDQPILRDPEFVPAADVLLLESTYGDKVHPLDTAEQLARIVREAAERGGALVVPAFAIGRTQQLIWSLRLLEESGKIPELAVYIDSPMAINVSEIYTAHPEDHDLDMAALMRKDPSPFASRNMQLIQKWDDSQALLRKTGPMVIISSSGMATGGRVLQHLRTRLPDARSTVLLTGYQAQGTRGRLLQEGARTLRMFGEEISVRAKIEVLEGASAHADREDTLRWLAGFTSPPRQTFLVHGEAPHTDNLASVIRDRLGWQARPAVDGEEVVLSK